MYKNNTCNKYTDNTTRVSDLVPTWMDCSLELVDYVVRKSAIDFRGY